MFCYQSVNLILFVNISSYILNRQILHHIHPTTGVRVPYTPHGVIPDVGPVIPTTTWEPISSTPWWFDSSFVVGYLTENARLIRIKNVLTGKETTLEVSCSTK